jgi:asparagine synthase (glutamine-hydrolysing)
VPAALAAGGMRVLNGAPLRGRARRLAYLLDRRPVLERNLDWVTERRRGLRAALYGPRLAAQAGEQRLVDELASQVDRHLATSVPGALMHLDQQVWLPDNVLVKADRAGMLVSLEIRTPYLHRELAEFAGSVAPAVHLANGGKSLLRAVLTDVLPADARPRPKTAPRVPAADWLRGPLAPVLSRQLEGGCLYAEGWIQAQAVGRLAAEHADGRRDNSHVLWPLLALGLWLDRLRGRDAP